jgi:hypothetical protein
MCSAWYFLRMSKPDRFTETFQTLRGILERNGRHMKVVTDTATDFTLASPTMVDRTGKPLFAAAVQVRKNYVSYHLMPVYMNPALMATVSPALRKRMQGKACFNFKTIDPAEAKELATLTKKGLAGFKDLKLPWA